MKRWIALILTTCMLLVCLSGCGSSTGSSDQSGQAQTQAEEKINESTEGMDAAAGDTADTAETDSSEQTSASVVELHAPVTVAVMGLMV